MSSNAEPRTSSAYRHRVPCGDGDSGRFVRDHEGAGFQDGIVGFDSVSDGALFKVRCN